MNWSFLAGLVWLVVANVIGLLPSKDYHWRNAYGLIAVLPLLAWDLCANGPWWGWHFWRPPDPCCAGRCCCISGGGCDAPCRISHPAPPCGVMKSRKTAR